MGTKGGAVEKKNNNGGGGKGELHLRVTRQRTEIEGGAGKTRKSDYKPIEAGKLDDLTHTVYKSV